MYQGAVLRQKGRETLVVKKKGTCERNFVSENQSAGHSCSLCVLSTRSPEYGGNSPGNYQLSLKRCAPLSKAGIACPVCPLPYHLESFPGRGYDLIRYDNFRHSIPDPVQNQTHSVHLAKPIFSRPGRTA